MPSYAVNWTSTMSRGKAPNCEEVGYGGYIDMKRYRLDLLVIIKRKEARNLIKHLIKSFGKEILGEVKCKGQKSNG